MKKYLLVGAAVAAASYGGLAHADSPGSCPLTYETFEFSVPHSDMDECPASMGLKKAFCRVAIVAEVATVFAFDQESNCIVKSKSFDEDSFKIEFKS